MTMLPRTEKNIASIVRVSASEQAGSLVVLPDFGGNTHYARPLVGDLGDALSCYVARLPKDLIREPGETSIEEIAARFAEEIIEAKLSGPINLLGFSFAGSLAFETGKQLALRGAKPEMVWVLDLPVRRQMGIIEYLKSPAWYTKDLSAYFALNWRKLILRRKNPDILSAYGILRLDLSRHPESYRHIMRVLYEAFRLYRPAPSTSPLTVVRASSSKHRKNLDETLGWSALQQGTIKTITVPGDHLSMLRDPENATVVAGHILDFVDKEAR